MINQELLKYNFSMGWYSTGIARYHEDTQEYLDGVDSDFLQFYMIDVWKMAESWLNLTMPEYYILEIKCISTCTCWQTNSAGCNFRPT
jgi:hypothetical protein